MKPSLTDASRIRLVEINGVLHRYRVVWPPNVWVQRNPYVWGHKLPKQQRKEFPRATRG